MWGTACDVQAGDPSGSLALCRSLQGNVMEHGSCLALPTPSLYIRNAVYSFKNPNYGLSRLVLLPTPQLPMGMWMFEWWSYSWDQRWEGGPEERREPTHGHGVLEPHQVPHVAFRERLLVASWGIQGCRWDHRGSYNRKASAAVCAVIRVWPLWAMTNGSRPGLAAAHFHPRQEF